MNDKNRINTNTLVQMEEYIPQEFKFTIGGFDSGYCIIQFKDNKLTHSFSNTGENNPYSAIEVIPTESQWKRFWTRVDEIQLWKWKKDYSDNSILDGEQWSLKIKIQDKTLSVYGSNRYPKSFKQFKNAIRELLGGLPLRA